MSITHTYQDGADGDMYNRRIGFAVVVSLLVHGVVFVLPFTGMGRNFQPGPEPSAPLVVDLRPEPEREEARRLIDTAVESPDQPEETELISDRNAEASDLSPEESDDTAPSAPEGDFEQVGGMEAVTPSEPASSPAPTDPAEEAEPSEPETSKPESEPDGPIEESDRPAEERIAVAAAPKELRPRAAAPQAQPSQLSDQQQEAVSQEQPSTPQPPTVPRDARTQSPVSAEAQNLGFLGFEAMRDDIAPYLRIIRDRVEPKWKMAVQTRYRGTGSAKAVIDCAIRPDGTLAYARIVEDGGSLRHALICKRAIESAAPFPPFPFEVPQMYRNDNLQIHWTFNFL